MVHNGADALDFIRSAPYDALVLDIMMPKMDGIEVLTAVRKMGIKTPALFLTATGEIEDRVAGLDAGADDYLPKPFATSEFLARVPSLPSAPLTPAALMPVSVVPIHQLPLLPIYGVRPSFPSSPSLPS